MEKYLAFDLGASSGRAIVGIFEGDQLRLEEIHRFPNRMVSLLGHYHWDVLQLFDEIKTGLAKTAAVGHRDVRSVGIDTWGVDFGLVGRDGSLLGNPYAYRDLSSDEVMQQVFRKVPREELYRMTGIQFLPFNSLFQLYRLAEEQHPWLEVADRLLFMPDLLNYFLTGEKVSEYTIASTSQMLDPWRKDWHRPLLEKLGLPMDILAPVVPPGTKLGKLRREIAEETGIGDIEVIAPACHDTASAVAAVPAQGERWAYLSSGTWSLLGVESPQPIINEAALDFNFTNEGGVHNKIRFLKNVAGLWILQQLKAGWAKTGEDLSYADLVALAEQAGPAQQHIDPDDPRFVAPKDMAAAILDYCRSTDQPVPSGKGQFVRCVLESLALKYKEVIANLNSLLPEPIERLHIVGGGSQNALLNRLTQETTGLQVITGPVEATAIGNILIQREAWE